MGLDAELVEASVVFPEMSFRQAQRPMGLDAELVEASVVLLMKCRFDRFNDQGRINNQLGSIPFRGG